LNVEKRNSETALACFVCPSKGILNFNEHSFFRFIEKGVYQTIKSNWSKNMFLAKPGEAVMGGFSSQEIGIQ